MRVRKVDTLIVEIPFEDGGKGTGITPTAWNTLEMLLVRVEDDDGNVGWGEGFGYFTVDATKALVDRLITPLVVGVTIDDVRAWNMEAQRKLALFGRYGVTIFALSGMDMALWDLAAKRAGVPLYRLLGGNSSGRVGPGNRADRADRAGRADRAAPTVPFYASLVRYGDVGLVREMSQRALAAGFTGLKLHELTMPEIRAAREAAGVGVPVAVDVNCNWNLEVVAELAPELVELGVSWLEEPVFPPEDHAALALARGHGLPIAAGENWCTAVQFAEPIRTGAVDLVQPSVTKVGGVSEFMRVAELAALHDRPLLPHCPYFGPGFFASLQLAAALPNVRELEYHFVDVEAWLAYPGAPDAAGALSVPTAPGLGFEPDLDVLQRYRREPRYA